MARTKRHVNVSCQKVETKQSKSNYLPAWAVKNIIQYNLCNYKVNPQKLSVKKYKTVYRQCMRSSKANLKLNYNRYPTMGCQRRAFLWRLPATFEAAAIGDVASFGDADIIVLSGDSDSGGNWASNVSSSSIDTIFLRDLSGVRITILPSVDQQLPTP